MAVPFDQRPDLIWLDSKLIATAECKIVSKPDRSGTVPLFGRAAAFMPHLPGN